MASQRSEAGFLPVNLLEDLLIPQKTILRSIVLTTPIHVHASVAHIGSILGDWAGQRINALKVTRWLQGIIWQPVNLHTTYVWLPEKMKKQVKMAFMQRIGHSQNTAESWDHIISTQQSHGGPVGYAVGKW